jgi:anti-sigma factor RsiW
MPDLDAAFQAAEQETAQTQRQVEDWRQRRQADARSHIAKLIVWAFVILVAVVVIAAGAGTYFLGWDKLVEPGKFMMAVLGSVMLPVVTLVIGYYFGKEN